MFLGLAPVVLIKLSIALLFLHNQKKTHFKIILVKLTIQKLFININISDCYRQEHILSRQLITISVIRIYKSFGNNQIKLGLIPMKAVLNIIIHQISLFSNC